MRPRLAELFPAARLDQEPSRQRKQLLPSLRERDVVALCRSVSIHGSYVNLPSAVVLLLPSSPSVVRRSEYLDGGDESADAFLQAAAAGPAPALLDYF